MKKLIYILLFLLLTKANSQDYKSLLLGFDNQNLINNSALRINNTYIFNSVANYSSNIFDGKLNLNHNYIGNGIVTNQTVFKDDEDLKLVLYIPIFQKLDFTADNQLTISAATNSEQWNNLSRNKTFMGLNFNYLDSAKINTSVGYENTTQLNHKITGLLYRFNGNLPNIIIFNTNFSADAYAVLSDLSQKIKSNDLDLNASLLNNFQVSDYFKINAKYKALKRDYYTLSGQTEPQSDKLRIEERGDDRFSFDGAFKYTFSENFTTNVNVEFQNRIVERGLRNQPEYTSTPSRVLEETGLNTYLSGIYTTDNYRQELNLDYSVRNEINTLKTNYKIDSTELNSLSQFENQKDNNSVRANFKSKSIFNLFNSDSLKVSYSSTIFRYDTPSQLNMDDRDEFFSLLNLEYNHKFSSNLFAGLVFENLQNHLVFLKSSRSSSNNWNKIYRLSPYLTIKTQDFSMQSQFEVLANYTIYDFEAINPSIKSYSYRQIGYKDSLFLNLGNSTNIQLKVTARLYERGVLYWKEFAESPQNRNLEIFSKMIFFSKPLYNLQAGIGARYFYLSQTKIGNNIPGAINNNFINKIWGPEAIIITNFSNGSSLSFQGWLEFRNYNSLNTITPNFFINCNLLL